MKKERIISLLIVICLPMGWYNNNEMVEEKKEKRKREKRKEGRKAERKKREKKRRKKGGEKIKRSREEILLMV